jgi:hypothetical protein
MLDYLVHRESWIRFPRTKEASSEFPRSLPSTFSGPINDSEAPVFGNSEWGNGWWSFHQADMSHLQRLPSWLLWDKLYREGGSSEVQFGRADGSIVTESIQSLLGLYLKEQASLKKKDPDRRYIIGMPDCFREEHQEILLRYLPWPRNRTQLLWRSVAATLGASAAADRLGMSIFEPNEEVLVVDIQNEYVEATLLRIIDSESGAPAPSDLVPIRSVPSPNCYWRSCHSPVDLLFGLRLFSDIPAIDADGCLGLIWGKNGLSRFSNSKLHPRHELLISTEDGLHRRVIDQQLLGRTAEYVVSRKVGTRERGILKDLKKKVGFGSPCGKSLFENLNELCVWTANLKTPPRKILLSGTIVRLFGTFSKKLNIIESALNPLLKKGVKILNGSLNHQVDLTSIGCAHWGALDECSFPGYFEYLEPFSIIGKGKSGRKVKYSLLKLENEEGLARGGKEYRNSDLKEVALINKGQSLVRFWLEKGKKHKKVEQQFDPPPKMDCKLSFDVTMVPSQGFARVEIIPDIPNVFQGRRLVLEWDRMVELTQAEMDGPMAYPKVTPVNFYSNLQTRKLFLIKKYIQAERTSRSLNRLSPSVKILSSMGKAFQNGRVLGSDPSHPMVDELIEALTSHFRLCKGFQNSNWEDDEIGKALLRTASSLFHRTPEWARTVLYNYMVEKRSENSNNPRPNVVLLNCCGRCFSRKKEIQVFVTSMISRFIHQLKIYSASAGAPSVGMDNWCRGLQTILKINEDANLHITLDQADKLQFLLCRLIELERIRNYRGPRRPGVSWPCQNAMLSIFYLLRIRGRVDGEDFIAPGTKSMKSIETTVESVNVGRWKWIPQGMPVGEVDSFQSSLLNFVRRTASMKDVRIIAGGEADITDQKSISHYRP